MKYPTRASRLPRRIISIAFAALLLGPGVARAAECPETSPEDPQERRKLAKDWFSRAESAENNGSDADATRGYACSYKMVAHPYTAYNLARVAERVGDNELALKMYKAYLTLKPDAQEKEKVKGKIKALEDKIASAPASGALGEGVAAVPAGAAAPLAEPSASPVEGTETGTEGATATSDGTAAPPAPQVEEVDEPPPPKPQPRPPVRARRDTESDDEPESPSRVAEWIIGGVSAGALVAGIVYNLSARSRMSACNAHAESFLLKTAENECNDARPMAYASYAFLGVAAAGAVLDTVLLIVRRGDDSDDKSSVGLMLLPDGGGLTARGRF